MHKGHVELSRFFATLRMTETLDRLDSSTTKTKVVPLRMTGATNKLSLYNYRQIRFFTEQSVGTKINISGRILKVQ